MSGNERCSRRAVPGAFTGSSRELSSCSAIVSLNTRLAAAMRRHFVAETAITAEAASTLEDKMKSKYLAAALLGTALLSGGAFAQNTNTDRSNINTAAAHQEGQWRSSKLIGVNVYNDNNDKIGEIEELIVDKSGKVDNVIIGVGGFLGMGEHYVAVTMDKLKWVNEPVRSSSSTAAPTNRPTTGANNQGTTTGEANRANRPARSGNEKWYPDHAVFNATKDQLKSMPQFKYD
jgi:sporulation protein YlmC with PRC-barrel domain